MRSFALIGISLAFLFLPFLIKFLFGDCPHWALLTCLGLFSFILLGVFFFKDWIERKYPGIYKYLYD